MTGARGKLLQIPVLRAPVALTERVGLVGVARHRTHAAGEAVRPDSRKYPAAAETGCHPWRSRRGGRRPPARGHSGTGGSGSPSGGRGRNHPPAWAHGGAGRPARAVPLPAPGCPGSTACCGERCGPADSSSLGRSFRRGAAAAVLDPAEDAGAAPLGRSSIAPGHLGHGVLLRARAITPAAFVDTRIAIACGEAGQHPFVTVPDAPGRIGIRTIDGSFVHATPVRDQASRTPKFQVDKEPEPLTAS